MLLAYAGHLGLTGVLDDTLDDQKGDNDMSDHAVMVVALSFTGAFMLLVASVLLIHREMQVRALNARVNKAIVGLPGHSVTLPSHALVGICARNTLSSVLLDREP